MRLAIAGVLIAVAVQSGARVAPPPVRFHHYHFRTGEPAAAMNAGATALKGTRVLLRGLGVGVRVDKQYALFDRMDEAEGSATVRQQPDIAYAAARAWLRANGVEVAEENVQSRESLGAAFATEILDHVAFTTADPGKVVAALVARGARVVRTTTDATLFGIEGTANVEIVRDLDRPDAFWCPMHPDVRAPDAGFCPVCRMALVPIPPPRIGEYRMDVAITPGPHGAGASALRLTIRDPETGRPVREFVETHERLLHLFIIDRSLEYFRHLHPLRVGPGVFALREPLPAGEYVAIADFLPQGGGTQMLQRAIVTPGYRGRMFPATPALAPDDTDEKQDAGVRVRLQASGLRAGKEATLCFTLTDAATAQEVTDLEPFLGAPGHMLLVNADLTEADHAHPEEATTTGPTITFQPLVPAAGRYKLWLQFQRRGVVATIPFVVSVEAR
jgi:hypothetical protein